jgi:hypothetical protein
LSPLEEIEEIEETLEPLQKLPAAKEVVVLDYGRIGKSSYGVKFSMG